MKTNQPLQFDHKLIDHIRINQSAIEARAKSINVLRVSGSKSETATLIKIIQCLDLTTLSGDDTPQKVEKLCKKALTPINKKILSHLGYKSLNLTVAAVCVYHNFVSYASNVLKNRIPVAAVAGGFPAGHIALDLKLKEIEYSIVAGATEIDVVIDRSLALTGQWKKLYDELKLFREVCTNRAILKTILSTGNLRTFQNVAKASAIAIMAGSDFIKTSTGFETTNAQFDSGIVMMNEIKRFNRLNKEHRVGFKAAGGIKTAVQALQWMNLVHDELGDEWINSKLFRIGASALRTEIEKQFT